ncbi:MAG: hypothetical protein OEU50_06775 [Gammaproteobacteria bacterium]|nr:hypothetical protein [Gammaproteobacteria bacterium]
MKYPRIPLFFLAAAMSASTLVVADDDDEEPFDEARLFFELNDTDGDLGIHGKIDGDEWKYLEIEDPRDRKMVQIRIRGRLRRQGLTELFFESAEPTFDELDPEKFFRRFPQGEYDIEGYTLDGEERESEVYLSHVIPAAPDNVMAGGAPSASLESCEGEDGAASPPVIADATDGVTISWDPVTMSHAARWAGDDEKIALGEDGIIDVRYYEVVVEIDESDFKATAIIPGDVTEWELPGDFFELAEGEDGFAQYKYEILVRTNVYDDDGNPVILEIDGELDNLPGNKSAIESCFLVPAADED